MQDLPTACLGRPPHGSRGSGNPPEATVPASTALLGTASKPKRRSSLHPHHTDGHSGAQLITNAIPASGWPEGASHRQVCAQSAQHGPREGGILGIPSRRGKIGVRFSSPQATPAGLV